VLSYFNPDNSSSSKHFQLFQNQNSFLSKKELGGKGPQNKDLLNKSINKQFHPKTKSISNILYNSNSSFLLKNEVSPLKPMRKKSLNKDISELFLINSFKPKQQAVKPKSKSILLPKIQSPNPSIKHKKAKFYDYDKYEFLKMSRNDYIQGKNIFKKKYKSRRRIANQFTKNSNENREQAIDSSEGRLEDVIQVQLIKSVDDENKDPNSEQPNKWMKVSGVTPRCRTVTC
jgi:hypothetical protein